MIHCPICDYEYSHIQAVRYEESVKILFFGECGHAWELKIKFSKGNNYVYVKKWKVPEEWLHDRDVQTIVVDEWKKTGKLEVPRRTTSLFYRNGNIWIRAYSDAQAEILWRKGVKSKDGGVGVVSNLELGGNQ